MLTVNLPDGSKKTFESSVSCLAVAEEIGPGLAKSAIAAEVDGIARDLSYRLPARGEVALKLFTTRDPASLAIMRHSCAHVMAQAVMRLYEGVQLAFGPTTGNGFYYDFALPEPLSEADFPAIEAEMKKIIKEDEPFERMQKSKAEAIELCRELRQDFKVEHLETGLGDQDEVSFYRQGEFIDLCRGVHIPSTGRIGKAFKLMSVAGAYWKGNAENAQLQRLYATAFFDKKELADHLMQIEEAKKRDHRELGKRLELFTINQTVGSGLILWLPKGAIIRQTLEEFIKSELRKRDYQPVYTPNIGRVELYKISGHFPYYSDSQFPLIDLSEREGCEHGEGERYLLKPMNCPHHIMIYKSKPRSYRDLPVRLAEFGTVYRYEQSGELSGMTRVRGFTQDDAHIFCTEEQVASEVRGCIDFTLTVLKSLGMNNFRARLGFRDPRGDKYVGSPAQWDRAEAAIEQVAREMNLPGCEPEPGEAAFYGPKIDFVVTDCIGREWQLGTVQLDYNLPSAERFDLEYTGSDNAPHKPVMIHRAPLGSMERFIGVLIEHFAGAFPLWLAPEQARVLTVSDKSEAYGREVEQQLRDAGLRVEGDYRGVKLGAKIREAQVELIPYMFVVGEHDRDNRTVTVRDRIEGDQGAMSVVEAIANLKQEIAEKRVRQVAEVSSVSVAEKAVGNEY